MTYNISENINIVIPRESASQRIISYKVVQIDNDELCNHQLLLDYWEFVDFDKKKFKFTLKELTTKYNLSKSNTVQAIAKKSGYIKFFGVKYCGKCPIEISFYRALLHKYITI